MAVADKYSIDMPICSEGVIIMKLAYPICSQDYKGPVMGFTDTYDSVFPKLKSYGYDGIELLIRDPDAVDTVLLEEKLNEYGLKIAGIGTNPMQKADHLFLMSPDKAVRAEARKRCSGIIDLCEKYGAVALIGKYRGMIDETEEGCTWDFLAKLTHSICEEARAKEVKICLEPQNKSNINNLITINDALEWIEKSGESNLGILADIYHMEITEQSIPDSIVKAADKVGFIHMSDSDRKIPGQGKIDIKSVVDAFKQINYSGYMSFEIDQIPDAETAAKECAVCIKAM